MPYTPTTWTDETPATTPIKYKITDDTAGVLADSAKIEVVTSVTAGTPLDATRLNKLEQGVVDATDTADTALAEAQQLAADHVIHGARVYHNTAQTIATGVTTALAFNAERYDTGGVHSTVTDTSRLTAPAAGVYVITGHVTWAANATGNRTLYLMVNGTTNIAIQRGVSPEAAAWSQSIATLFELQAGDYVELVVRHTADVSLAVASVANSSPEFAMQRIG